MNGVRRIKIPTELSRLARVFPVDLYIVGGYIRNQLLGIEQGDIDLCSSLTIDKLAKAVEESGFVVKSKNKDMGTAKLVFGDIVYDYVTFREEKYGTDKAHRPEQVEFIDNIHKDAARRDFSVNAIYYNINKQTIIDYHNGLIDLRRGVIKAIGNADDVMKNDGERVLRMIRLAGELNFKIDKATFKSAIKNVSNLYGISADRISLELGRILNCDKRYPGRAKKKAFVNSLKILNRMSVWRCFGLEIDKINYNMVKKVKDRGLGLIIDMVDTANPASVSYFVEKLFKNVSINKKKLDQIIKIISGYYDALNKKNTKQYFFKYFDNFEEIYPLIAQKNKFLAQKYQFFYKYIISYHLVIKRSDLMVSAKDLKAKFPSLPVKMYGEVLDGVLSDVFDGKYPNEREIILKEIAGRMTIRKS